MASHSTAVVPPSLQPTGPSSPSPPKAVISRTSVLEVRAILSSFNLPTELVLHIMDIASYHSSVRAERSDHIELRARHGPNGGCWGAQLYLVSAALPQRAPEDIFWQIKKVSWEVQGHDQGWASFERAGGFQGAWSWFDACIFRPFPTDRSSDGGHDEPTSLTDIDGLDRVFFDARRGLLEVQELLRPAGWSMVANDNQLVWRLQLNRVATLKTERHVFEWNVGVDGVNAEARDNGSGDGKGFVEALQPGDRVGIWMQAKYPGWVCHAEGASVEIMYEFR